MIDSEKLARLCRVISDNTPTTKQMAQRFIDNFTFLMFQPPGMPERILNVSAYPPWAIDAGCD